MAPLPLAAIAALALTLALAAAASASADSCAAPADDAPSLAHTVDSTRPLVFHFPRFLSDTECDALVALAEPQMRPSHTDSGLEEQTRRSYAHFFSTAEEQRTPVIRRLKARVLSATHIPLEHYEGLQVQRYRAPLAGAEGAKQVRLVLTVPSGSCSVLTPLSSRSFTSRTWTR